ncbi:hypothetical protein EV126DRAFT_429208 [Verticillium dahliae]|nr:hypothetical protein EV126DRAFT_429208 [Verticillium dahliae]
MGGFGSSPSEVWTLEENPRVRASLTTRFLSSNPVLVALLSESAITLLSWPALLLGRERRKGGVTQLPTAHPHARTQTNRLTHAPPFPILPGFSLGVFLPIHDPIIEPVRHPDRPTRLYKPYHLPYLPTTPYALRLTPAPAPAPAPASPKKRTFLIRSCHIQAELRPSPHAHPTPRATGYLSLCSAEALPFAPP